MSGNSNIIWLDHLCFNPQTEIIELPLQANEYTVAAGRPGFSTSTQTYQVRLPIGTSNGIRIKFTRVDITRNIFRILTTSPQTIVYNTGMTDINTGLNVTSFDLAPQTCLELVFNRGAWYITVNGNNTDISGRCIFSTSFEPAFVNNTGNFARLILFPYDGSYYVIPRRIRLIVTSTSAAVTGTIFLRRVGLPTNILTGSISTIGGTPTQAVIDNPAGIQLLPIGAGPLELYTTTAGPVGEWMAFHSISIS